MDYKQEIKNIMKNYAELKATAMILAQENRTEEEYRIKSRLDFFDFCVELLETYEKELLLTVCVNGISIRQYSKATGFSRNFIAKERDRLTAMLNRFFVIKFESP